jgi:hypothetical protein
MLPKGGAEDESVWIPAFAGMTERSGCHSAATGVSIMPASISAALASTSLTM